MRRLVVIVVTVLVVAGCGSGSWTEQQGERIAEAGVTFPPEQERLTIISMTSACSTKELNGDTPTFRDIWTGTQPRVNDWVSEADALKMWQLADSEFCSTIPDDL